MCEDCGCGDTKIVPVEVHERILATNDRDAQHNREHFEAQGTLAINLMGSPGSGKTALLEATARAFDGKRRFAAVSGDLATDRDAERLRRAGIPALGITTGSACHLDAAMVHHALHDAPWIEEGLPPVDGLFIENVGNLVCPAIYDLGQKKNVVALSVTEGVDKPIKYPVMFQRADLVVITKIDLLPHLDDVSIREIASSLAQVMPEPRFIAVSARTGDGIAEWTAWLEAEREDLLRTRAATRHPHHHDHHHHDHGHDRGDDRAGPDRSARHQGPAPRRVQP